MQIDYLKIFCRQGKIMLATSEKLDKLLKDKKDYYMVLPFAFEEDHVQIKEIDFEEFKNLLPNAILTSHFQPNFDDIELKKHQTILNSKPFVMKNLKHDAKDLLMSFSNGLNNLFK